MKKLLLYASIILGVSASFVACNKDNGGNNQPVAGVCPAGQFQTQYGCAGQGSCQVGYAQTQYGCQPVINNNGYNGGNSSGYYFYYGQYYPYWPQQAQNCTYKSWYWYCF